METDVLDLDAIVLQRGSHSTRNDGCCAMELAAWLAGEPHSAHPGCVCPVLTEVFISVNDNLEDEPRQRLKPLLPRLLGTSSDGAMERRAWMALDWSVREILPHALDLFPELKEHTRVLRSLPAINDEASAKEAGTKLAAASEAARNFVDAHSYNARALALDLDRALALDLDLALARARARALALDLARALARALALDLARALALALALDLALDDSELAAFEAAAREKLRLIDESTFTLLDRLIAA